MVGVSVIIPLAPNELSWKGLVSELSSLTDNSEIILSLKDGETMNLDATDKVLEVSGKPGRAQQMNTAARTAKYEWLWFLHADSRLTKETIPTVLKLIESDKQALFYHDLAFSDDGPQMMRLNARAVRWRSDLLKMPFGDQGFLIPKDLFFKLGGYREDVPFGEDHILTWKVRQEGYQVLSTGTKIYTSARKYRDRGWANTTLRHVWLTITQAAPQFFLLIRKRIFG